MPNQYGSMDDEIKALVSKARARGEWFYSNQTDRWMTPDQYQDEYDYHKITGSPQNVGWLREYKLKDPKHGIHARMIDITKAVQELNNFVKIVFDYCNFTEKDKPST